MESDWAEDLQLREALPRFVAESNTIEGISVLRVEEIEAHGRFLVLPKVEIVDLEQLVHVLQPDAVLRDRPGLNVRVGNHVPPSGGPRVRLHLEQILAVASSPDARPFRSHCAYETLHPFMDGNGRSGRALWLWQHLRIGTGHRALRLGFLHSFYYETLAALGRDMVDRMRETGE